MNQAPSASIFNGRVHKSLRLPTSWPPNRKKALTCSDVPSSELSFCRCFKYIICTLKETGFVRLVFSKQTEQPAEAV